MSTQENLAKNSSKYTRQTDPGIARPRIPLRTETLNKDPTIPREAIVSMVRLMADLGLVDRLAATNTPPESFYDNSFCRRNEKDGFLRDLWK